jgi:coenzyme F420-reducing hydrogenase gamma subunit
MSWMRNPHGGDRHRKAVGDKGLKVAFYSFGGCDGCSYELLNLDEALLNAIEKYGVEIAHSVVFGVPSESKDYDVAFVEGTIASEEDARKIKEIRKKSKVVVAMGSCAALSGIPGLRSFTKEDEIGRVYAGVELEHKPLEEAFPLSKFVKVDYHLRGCPTSKIEFVELLDKIASGKWWRQGERRFDYSREKTFDIEGTAVTLDGEKCYVCGRCVKICEGITNAIDYANRSVDTIVSTPFKVKFDESSCISCGQCTLYCPVGAMKERSSVKEVQGVLKAGENPTAYVEPEVIAALGETLGVEKDVGRKLATALRQLGFKKVILGKPQNKLRLDDLTIVPSSEAEARFVELFYPDLVRYMIEPPEVKEENAVWLTSCVARKLGKNLALTTRELIRLMGTLDLSLETVGWFDKALLKEENEDEFVATGISEMRETLEKIRKKSVKKGTVKLYCCPDGCLNGGGQPFADSELGEKRRQILAQILRRQEK